MNKSAIRILHASSETPSLDIFLNGELMVEKLGYEALTDYLSEEPGEYNIKVFAAGETTNPLVDIDLSIAEGELTTIAVTGVLPQVSLLPAVQTIECPVSGQALVRFIHLSPDAPPVDVTLSDNTSLFIGVEYREVSDYQKIEGGKHQVQVGRSGLENTVLQVPELIFTPDQVYSLYLIGRLEGQPDLKVIPVKDSTVYCVRETAHPLVPDVKPYQRRRVDIKVKYQ